MWYIIQVMTGYEEKIMKECELLTDVNEEVFIPSIVFEKKVRGEEEETIKPMFPGYIFFETGDVEDLFYRLKKVVGLTRILRTGDDFTPLPDGEADVIKRLGGDAHLVELSVGYKTGDRVRITEGPLKEFEGEIVRIDRRKRTATIRVGLLGEEREIKVGLKVLNNS